MKIFLDTANRSSIKQWAATGIIDGVTTNPTHLSKAGGDPLQVIKEICALLPEGDISVQVTEKDPEAVYQQAKNIAKIAPQVTVKIPCHRDYYPVIRRLAKEGVRINITLLFTLAQGLLVSKMGVRYISPFVGRLDDTNGDGAGMGLVDELCCMREKYKFTTQILVGSVRSVEHVQQAILLGADVVTLSADLLVQAATHPLTDKGMALFDADWAKLGVRQFP